jgi:release factor glutamine methyltransferase
MPSIRALLLDAARRVNRQDARILLSHVLGVPKEFFIAHPEQEVSEEDAKRFGVLLAQAADGCPTPYLTGTQAFWSRDFRVTVDVLIPRPDTETVVETVLDLVKDSAAPGILELGTGSGCIAVTLALEIPGAQVLATDVSEKALAVARDNANRLHASNVSFTHGSWFEAVPENARFNIIVSNPPYIASDEIIELDSSVRDYEPIWALDGGKDGLRIYKGIRKYWKSLLRPGGFILFEVGEDQAQTVKDMVLAAGFAAADTRKDSQGIDRVVIGRMYDLDNKF